MTFKEFKKKALAISDMSDRTQFVLNEIFSVQRSTIITRSNLFIGTLTSNFDGTHWFVSNLKTIANESIARYPYEIDEYGGRSLLSVHCDSETGNLIGASRVIVSVKCGRLYKENELLEVSEIQSFSSLELMPDASPNEIRMAVLKNGAFVQERESVQADLEKALNIPDLQTEAQILSDTIAEFKTEKEKYDNALPELRSEYTELSDTMSSLRKEKDEIQALLSQRDSINDDVNALNKQKETLKNDVSELQATRDGLLAMKREAIQASRLVKFFLGNTVVDEHLGSALPIEGEDPIKTIRNRLDFDYSDAVLIPFLSALSTTQIITLFGKPGTGKTTFVTKIAKALGAKCSVISVQNNWTDSADILGYYSPIDKTYESTAFMEALLSAQRDWVKYNNQSRLHIICLDEMNLARVEYYFASFLSILQLPEEERWIRPLPKHIQQELNSIRNEHLSQIHASDGDNVYLSKEDVPGKEYLYALREYVDFKLPPNVRFVGTINSDDTTNFLSPKVIDRSFYIELTSEQYSQDKELQDLSGFFPVEFFEVDNKPENDIITVFPRENNRFKTYAQQMLKQYRNHLGNTSTNLLFDYIVMGKVLPALHTTSDFIGYSESDFPLSSRAFESHKPQNNGSLYNYLGG